MGNHSENGNGWSLKDSIDSIVQIGIKLLMVELWFSFSTVQKYYSNTKGYRDHSTNFK